MMASSLVAAYGAIFSATSALPSPSKSPVMNGVHQTPMFMFQPRSYRHMNAPVLPLYASSLNVSGLGDGARIEPCPRPAA